MLTYTRFNDNNTVMEVNGLKCVLNMPKAVARVKNPDGSEGVSSLPPYGPRTAYPVDHYPTSPDSWMRGSATESSYFVPVLAEHGMWLDFNANRQNTHHVAVVVSVQGVNPLTGMAVDSAKMEQYKENCPKHNVPFQMNRYCPSCKYEWHPQNYISSNSGGPFWIDGFRTEDGVIRQWYFTEEECKGVAAQLIGKKRVYAIGIKFYVSKNPKPRPTFDYEFLGGGGGGLEYLSAAPMAGSPVHTTSVNSLNLGSQSPVHTTSVNSLNLGSQIAKGGTVSDSNFRLARRTRGGVRGSSMERLVEEKTSGGPITPVKQLEIGAGAKIQQVIGADPESLDYWQMEPAGTIYINYCDQETANLILNAGKRDKTNEGFLDGLNLKD